jgi:Na+-translocating ferredoxin:NAD+ oxidoreductase subunit B
MDNSINIILISTASLAALGLIAGLGLAYFAEKFKVILDPNIEKILKVLPGTNCGACGKPSCMALAEAISKGEEAANSCKLGGADTAKNICEIMGISNSISYDPVFAVVQCEAGRELCQESFVYQGAETCLAANSLAGGPLACSYGCLAYGDCVKVCPVDAFEVRGKKAPRVIKEKCIGCGKCVEACPRNLIKMYPAKQSVFVLCNTSDKGAQVKKTCKVGCIGCRICAKKSPEGSITMEGRLPIINPERNEDAKAGIAVCPQKTIYNIE